MQVDVGVYVRRTGKKLGSKTFVAKKPPCNSVEHDVDDYQEPVRTEVITSYLRSQFR